MKVEPQNGEPQNGEPQKSEPQFEKRNRLFKEIIETVVLTALMFLIINIAVQNYDVDGPSMEPSLHDHERIMVDKVSYLFHSPARGDVVVFIAPPHPSENYVKRIIAIPGDVVTIKGTTVIVGGATLNETYVAASRQGNYYYDHPNYPQYDNFVIPKDQYLALGDDRVNSSDGRDWGLLPRGNIIGRAALVYWPFGQDNSGFLPNVSSVYAKVHQGPAKAALVPVSQVVDGRATVNWESSALIVLVVPAFSVCSSRLSRKRHARKEADEKR